MVIKRVQEKITKFLRKNKNDKIKRCTVIYQSLSSGGLNFPNFRTVVKSLRLSWLGRFLNRKSESWQAIPNYSFNRYGQLPFLLKCSYDSILLSFIVKGWIILRNGVQVTLKSIEVSEFILCNNKEITIENKSVF